MVIVVIVIVINRIINEMVNVINIIVHIVNIVVIDLILFMFIGWGIFRLRCVLFNVYFIYIIYFVLIHLLKSSYIKNWPVCVCEDQAPTPKVNELGRRRPILFST